jgi:hypothetical protein
MAAREWARWYLSALEKKPYVTKGLISGVMKGLSDVTGQLLVDKKINSYQTILSKFIFEFFIGTPIWHNFYKYVNYFSMYCIKESKFLRILLSTFIDQTTMTPLFYIIWYYCIGILESQTLKDIKQQVHDELIPTIISAWKVWPFYTFFQMYFLPEQLWIPVGNIVSYTFGLYLKLRDLYYKQNKDSLVVATQKIYGSCTCGSVTYRNMENKTLHDIWGMFICHCSQCPKNSKTWFDKGINSSGTPWVAIPRSSYKSPNKSLVIKNLSNFADRGICKKCGDSVYIRYMCEKHTDWVHMKTLIPKLKLDPPLLYLGNGVHKTIKCQHIHCKSTCLEKDFKGIPIYDNEGVWEPDPCREKGQAEPNVCSNCWQLIDDGNCKCG